jgi:hypothetical protein
VLNQAADLQESGLSSERQAGERGILVNSEIFDRNPNEF